VRRPTSPATIEAVKKDILFGWYSIPEIAKRNKVSTLTISKIKKSLKP
jgi:hypothetical protein